MSTTVHHLSIVLVLLVPGVTNYAQGPSTNDSYTPAQALSGQRLYSRHCSECHQGDLRGAFGPPLAGPNFMSAWGTDTVQSLFQQIRTTMPPGAEDSLSSNDYLEIVAYILQTNGHIAGNQELQANSTLTLNTLGGTIAANLRDDVPAAQNQPPARPGSRLYNLDLQHKEIESFSDVTEELLDSPPPGDWLSWRRTRDGLGYSPLSEINQDNVRELRLAWVWAMHEGRVQTAPLVHDGVMFVANPGNILQALDAKNGDILWEYRHQFASEATMRTSLMRSIALYKDKVFMTTADAKIVAVNARTGRLVWETEKADPAQGFSHSGGPIVANGVIVSGVTGCSRFTPVGCFITGHDPETGQELWRTSTIAQPGEPGGDTWGDLPLGVRGGTESWIPGSYDRDLNLFFIGTSQAKPWAAVSRGITPYDAALYSNSTLALDPLTGEIRWYFQHVPGESLDLDTVFERVLIDIDEQPVVITVGKDGLMWKLDRRNGSFLNVVETVYQDIFETIDSTTGRVTYRPDILNAKIGEPIHSCPAYYGGHNWPASAYSPSTETLLVPLNQNHCSEMTARDIELSEGSGSQTGSDVRFFERDGSNGKFGRLSSYNVRTLQEVWSHEQRASFSTGVMTTESDLAFVGDVDRYFKAFDLETGEVLWQVRLGSSAVGFPVTYTVNEKQYIAVPTEVGAFPNIRRWVSPDIYTPNGGNAVYVFALPEALE